MLVGYLGAALGSFAVAMAVATVFILIVAHLFAFPIANVVIAFAPGAQDTMMVLALALHLDPVYVGAHHLARFLVVTIAIAVAARRVARQGSVSADGKQESGTPGVENSAMRQIDTAVRDSVPFQIRPSSIRTTMIIMTMPMMPTRRVHNRNRRRRSGR